MNNEQYQLSTPFAFFFFSLTLGIKVKQISDEVFYAIWRYSKQIYERALVRYRKVLLEGVLFAIKSAYAPILFFLLVVYFDTR
jgi:hypothetical protein